VYNTVDAKQHGAEKLLNLLNCEIIDEEDGAEKNPAKKTEKGILTDEPLPSAEVKTTVNAVILATQTSSESVSLGLIAVLSFVMCVFFVR